MTREELYDLVYYIPSAYDYAEEHLNSYEWFKNDSDFDSWANETMCDYNWDDARRFLNDLPETYASGYYLRPERCFDDEWEYFDEDSCTPDWLIETIIEHAEDRGLIDDYETEHESESNSCVDTLADPPKPEDTISFEDFDSLFEEVAS